jgi:hypothetical protein
MGADTIALEDRLHHARLGTAHRWSTVEIAAAVANAAVAVAVVAVFYHRFWWAPDEGVYAYIADRLLHGDVLNRDVQDIHGGYVHFLHALALDLFGRDFLSLRYPLALLTVIQSCIVFALLRPSLGAAAIAGGLAMAALTFVQFVNPTANWYALLLTVVLIALLAAKVQESRLGLVSIGFLIALIFLFRQLTGVLVGIGAIAYLLVDDEDGDTRTTSAVLARATIAAMALGLAAYLWSKTDATGFVLYGAMPLAVLIAVGVRTGVQNRRILEMIVAMTAGAAAAVLPLFLYHASNGSLESWADDVFVSAISLTELDFFKQATYARLLALAGAAVTSGGPAAMLNGAFWLIVFLSPLALGVAIMRRLWSGERGIHPVAFVALFYGLVSAHYAIPIYALFSTGLTLAGLLALSRGPAARAATVGVTAFAVAVGLAFQAAQPLTRGLEGIIRGERVALDADGLPRAHVRMEKRDQAMYADLVAFIDKHAAPEDTILGLPMTAELYFLADRRAPVRFAIAPLGLTDNRAVDDAWNRIEAARPAVVAFKPRDKYTTPLVQRLMMLLKQQYRLCTTIGPFELYARACPT